MKARAAKVAASRAAIAAKGTAHRTAQPPGLYLLGKGKKERLFFVLKQLHESSSSLSVFLPRIELKITAEREKVIQLAASREARVQWNYQS